MKFFSTAVSVSVLLGALASGALAESFNCKGSSSCTLTGAPVANNAIARYADNVVYTPTTSRTALIAAGPLGYTAIYRCDNGISVQRTGAQIKDGFGKLRANGCVTCGTWDFGDGCHATINFCASCKDTN